MKKKQNKIKKYSFLHLHKDIKPVENCKLITSQSKTPLIQPAIPNGSFSSPHCANDPS